MYTDITTATVVEGENNLLIQYSDGWQQLGGLGSLFTLHFKQGEVEVSISSSPPIDEDYGVAILSAKTENLEIYTPPSCYVYVRAWRDNISKRPSKISSFTAVMTNP